MKKKIMMILVVATLIVSAIALVACGGKDAKAKMEVKQANSQIDALMEIKAKTADVAIIDATMAGYLLNKEGGSFSDLKIVKLDGVDFVKEYYGVAAKKGNDALISFVNAGIKKTQQDGTYNTLLAKYGLTDRANDITSKEFTVDPNWANSLKDNKVVIGFTNNAPMGISDDNDVNKGTGFDIELAQAIFANSGVTVETKLIQWDNKEIELENGTIDLVWNGLTITPERQENMAISAEYLFNEQAVVVLASEADNFKSVEDLKGMLVIVEAGSAGEENATKIAEDLNK